MRFESFELARYGHFSDRKLIFPRHEYDFHIVFGNNEAGKSTIRQAFHDLFFGIPPSTTMAFMHATPDLALNAVLSGELGEVFLGRRRKARGGLVDETGDKLPDEVLERWLGGVTPAFHERMFGLDHQRLEQGSRAMLQAGDDVDSVLFQAAAGLSTLNSVLASLREEAAGLWTPHRAKNRAWYAAHDRYREAEQILKAATVRPTAWQTAYRESRRMEDAFNAAREKCAQLKARQREIERLRRLAPLMTQVEECEQLLQDNSSGQRSYLLEFEPDILALEETRLRVAGHADEIEQCESQLRLLRDQLSDVLRQLGSAAALADARQPSCDLLQSIAERLPTRPLRAEIIGLLDEGRELNAQGVTANQNRESREAEMRELEQSIASLPSLTVGSGLRRALHSATAAGDLSALIFSANRKLEQAEGDLVSLLQALSQPEFEWESDLAVKRPGQALDAEKAVAVLQRMQPFPVEALTERIQRRQQLQAALDASGKRQREAQREFQTAQLKFDQFRRSHQAVSREQVLAARRDRDTFWQGLMDDPQSIATLADEYAAKVLLADTLVDRQLAAVDDAARFQALEQECERLQLALDAAAQDCRGATEALAAFDEQWHEDCISRCLPPLPPAGLHSWLPSRVTALQSYRTMLEARRELSDLHTRYDSLITLLRTALSDEAGLCSEQVRKAGLAECCELARDLLDRAEAAAAKRAALNEQLQRLQPLIPRLREACADLESSHALWLGRKKTALQRAGLPEDAEDSYIKSALELFAEADDLMQRMRTLQAKRDQLNTELDGFFAAVQSLAGKLQVTDFHLQRAELHLKDWVRQLAPLRDAERDRDLAKQRLLGLMENLHKEGEGRNREQIAAELAHVDMDTLAAEADRLVSVLEDAEQERDRLAVERQQAQEALESVSGTDEAAKAEAMRQEAMADMAEVADRYVRVYTQYRLLERITERYRERSQGPLLTRATELFRRLTLGAYVGLEVDGEAATLWARHSDSRLVPLSGLSDGTRDQLYLALRLAALELYLNHARPLPFIADDLFINYDDRRTLAGLKELSETSRRTQVIFLTHHAHMVEIARAQLGGRVQVIELGTPNK